MKQVQMECWEMGIWKVNEFNFWNEEVQEFTSRWGQNLVNVRIRTVSFIIFWDFSIFYQIFFLPQVKRWAIITYKHGIYELSRKLLNDLRLRILGNYDISENCLKSIEWQTSARSPRRNESFVNASRKLLKNRN